MTEAKLDPSDSDSAGAARPVWETVLRHRRSLNVLLHAALFSISLLVAFMISFEAVRNSQGERPGLSWFLPNFLPCLPFFIILKLALFWRGEVLRGGWQYSSIRDIANILRASWWFVFVTFICILLVLYLPQALERKLPSGPVYDAISSCFSAVANYFSRFPKGVLVVDFICTVFLVSTARLGFRIYREELRPVSSEGVRRVLIVGAGNAAEAIIREIHRSREERYRVVGLVDDDPAKKDLAIHGVGVLGGTADIGRICQEKNVEELIIAMPSASQKQLRRVIELCSGTKLRFQSLPGVGDLIDGRVTVSQIRPVDIGDLLGRKAVEMDDQSVKRFLRGRRVLITGAGGSIGSEMCRQVIRYQPAGLVLLEQAENPLFEIDGELRSWQGDTPVVPCVCDIHDRQRVMAIWEHHRPEVVIHAAAHKHVPLMEQNPCEAIKNNIVGTRNVADASCKYGAAEFVMISTDKAVNPSSIMGATKRVAEIYTQSLNGLPECKTQFKAVRFGNVLGSSGSVIPTFRKQIAAGGPVTVTHGDMTRYFMTIPEAAQLVIQAAATGQGGQIFLLDMGEPVKIVDLARQMITLSGFRPGEDIDIVFSGIRPGEKLFEELRTDGEDIAPTVHPKINIWKHRPMPWAQAAKAVDDLAALEVCPDRQTIVEAIRKVVPEYKPLNPPSQTSTSIAVAAPAQAVTQQPPA